MSGQNLRATTWASSPCWLGHRRHRWASRTHQHPM